MASHTETPPKLLRCLPPEDNGLLPLYSHVDSHDGWKERTPVLGTTHVYDCARCDGILTVHRQGPYDNFEKARLELSPRYGEGETLRYYWRYSGQHEKGIVPVTEADYWSAMTGSAGRTKRGRSREGRA